MRKLTQLVVFSLDEQLYALHLSAVAKVVRMVDITPLPKAPQIVVGVVNVRGRVIPVVNVRRRFGLPEREASLTDQIILASTARRQVALVVDAVISIIECSEQELVTAESVFPQIEHVEGLAKLKGGLVLIHSLDKFLSLEEEKSLDCAMELPERPYADNPALSTVSQAQ